MIAITRSKGRAFSSFVAHSAICVRVFRGRKWQRDQICEKAQATSFRLRRTACQIKNLDDTISIARLTMCDGRIQRMLRMNGIPSFFLYSSECARARIEASPFVCLSVGDIVRSSRLCSLRSFYNERTTTATTGEATSFVSWLLKLSLDAG